jgi:hypothetical protein
LDVFVGAVVDPNSAAAPYAGTATNAGSIIVPEGDVTMTGENVDQLGTINSSTSVTLNGRIDLLANYNSASVGGAYTSSGGISFLQQDTGTVILGPDSVSQIVPELSSAATVVGTQLALSSEVNVQALAIYMGKGAVLYAPGAAANFSAGNWKYQASANAPTTQFVYNGGQIYIDSGATIDVAGSEDVPASVLDNIITVQLRGAELADSPLERSSVLEGQNLQIDISQTGVYDGQAWVGTPLGNAFGYLGLIQRTAGELTVNGGTVNLDSGGSVVTQAGSTIDVSGGWIDYQGAEVQTTRLISDGIVYDIADAYPDIAYDGIYTGTYTVNHSKYALTQTYASPLAPIGAHYEASYIEGGNGGAVNIVAPTMALDGDLVGDTVAGPRQLSVEPTPSTLSLSFQNQSLALESEGSYPTVDPTPPEIIIGAAGTLPAVGPFALDSSGNPLALPEIRQAEVVLSPDLVNSDGFDILNINNGDGSIIIPSGTSLDAPANASSAISIEAANLTIGGSIVAPGGSLSFNVYDFTPLPLEPVSGTPPIDPERGNLTLGPGATLSTAGLIVDNRDGVATAMTQPQVYSGGSISIESLDLNLAAGSTVNVSGGVELASNGKPTYGKAGSIVIGGSVDPSYTPVSPVNYGNVTFTVNTSPISSVAGGALTMDATLEGYSGATGGALSITAPLVQVGGATTNPDTLLLSPGFFSQGGFASFTIGGIGEALADGQYLTAVEIAPGAVIDPVAKSLVVNPAGGGAIKLVPYLEPEGVRTPVSLTFNAAGVNNGGTVVTLGDIVVGAGAVIRTDALGSVNFDGQTVAIEGSIFAPGGTITVTGASTYPLTNLVEALPTVDLAPGSVLSVAGETVLTANAQGYRTGSVLPGGTITVKGNIVGEAGAVLDVSGATDVLDLAPSYTNLSAAAGNETVEAVSSNTTALDSLLGAILVPTRVDSSGGSIVLAGSQELYMDATLLGSAGGPSAYGGSLSVSSGPTVSVGQSPLQVTLTVTQSGETIKNPHFYPAGQTAIGYAVDSNAAVGGGYFSVSSFESGGFDSLSLNASSALGAVDFSGPVTVTARGTLDVAGGGVLTADSAVNLTAPYVILGIPFSPPLQTQEQSSAVFFNATAPVYFLPTNGNGSLTVTASLIDVGTLSMRNIGNVNLLAPNGDIRGDGTLDVAGNLFMEAGQIYTPTDSFFTIDVSDYTSGPDATVQLGTVTFAASGTRQLPLSAGGEINVYGSVINQGGVLRAPLGIINLGWDGGSDANPVDLLTGAGSGNALAAAATVDPTQQLTLEAGSVTSVSQIDPVTGKAVVIPYGVDSNGTAWIDPTNTDITSTGPPAKAVHISAQNVSDEPGALIDVRGGGDLLAYQFVSGNGGTVDLLGSPTGSWGSSQSYSPGDLVSYKGATYSATVENTGVVPTAGPDWTLVPQEYAVIPGYQADYAPYAPFSQLSESSNYFGTDAGYVSSSAAGRSLSVGDQVYLGASQGLAAGVYTLLPARYALLPGAYLVTPESGAPVGTEVLPDGSTLVSGYRFNNLTAPPAQPLASSFDVASQAVVNTLAQYDILSANSFFATVSSHNSAARLPVDAGHVVFEATTTMSIQGSFDSQAAAGGLGALVDVSSPENIVIGGDGVTAGSGELLLNASELTAIGAQSLLVGGLRDITSSGQTVTVQTDDITVNNAGSPLAGSDIILAANQNLTLDTGAQIESAGDAGGLSPILLSGNGVAIRVSSDSSAMVERTGVTTASEPELTVDANADISGAGVTLDSSYGTSLDPDASIRATALALNSGQITIALADPGAVSQTSGLVLTGNALTVLQSGLQTLALLSYTSIDIYGTGQIGALDANLQPTLENLSLEAGEIRGFNDGGGQVTFAARNVTLDNSPDVSGPGPVAGNTPRGTLAFDAGTITLGVNQLDVDQYANLVLNASGSVLGEGSGGLAAERNLSITAPLVTGAGVANQKITASGAFTITAPSGGGSATGVAGGLGATLTLVGASLAVDSTILLPSGDLTLHATGGNLTVGGQLNAGGEALPYFDLIKYTDGGQITLMADQGNVQMAAGSVASVAAQAGGGNAGTLTISAPEGTASLLGTLLGQGGNGGAAGSFSLDVGSIPAVTLDKIAYSQGSLDALDSILDAGSFTQSISIRDRTDSNVTLDASVTADAYNVSVDNGSISIAGTINASDIASVNASGAPVSIGGSITLEAGGSVTLLSGAVLTVAAENYNDAQRGGSVDIEAGSEINDTISGTAVVDIEAGSTINLSVADPNPVTGDLAGALLLVAPQIVGTYGSGSILAVNAAAPAGATLDLNIAPIAGNIIGAGSIVAAGSYVQDAATTGAASIDTYDSNGDLDSNSMEAMALANASTFMASSGDAATGGTIINRLIAGNSSINPAIFNVEPAEQIDNSQGDLVLNQTWDLSTARYGENGNVPGILTLRAAGNLIFESNGDTGFPAPASLSDGFDLAESTSGEEYTAPLLPAGSLSWSYNLVAGGDFSAANPLAVVPNLPSDTGSLLLGANGAPLPTGSEPDLDPVAIAYFQTIRTGDGNIQIAASQDVQLLDDLATIYTAGTQVAPLANFVVPDPNNDDGTSVSAQYSMDGGDVSIYAGHDIVRYQYDLNGDLVADSSRELPNNWLYREGWVDPTTGQFGDPGSGVVESTSWWVDFTNFYEGVGALGGGNVTMIAGNNVTNVDAAIPTNAMMPEGAPNAANLVQLGGGDLVVRAGNDISGGVYYVESGHGTLSAGGEIETNATRAAEGEGTINEDANDNVIPDPSTWLPTTLFAGDASFDIQANGSILLGPVANVFVLPQGSENNDIYKTYFSTYASTDSVDVSSLSGSVTIRDDPDGGASSLQQWMTATDLTSGDRSSFAAESQPWLGIVETGISSFANLFNIMPPTLEVTAFSGNINLDGSITLTPSATGNVQLIAGGSVNGFQPNSVSGGIALWGSSEINLSDADPSAIPSIADPLSYPSPNGPSNWNITQASLFTNLLSRFMEYGSIAPNDYGSLQDKEALHAPGILHAADPNPVDIYALDGSISGLTLFAGKETRALASEDITDIAFYIQNDNSANVSVVAAGGDITLYDPSSPLRELASTAGNEIPAYNPTNLEPASSTPTAGDLQINGPGTLEVLAGGNLSTGLGSNDENGTAVGITSIGNDRNPYLPFAGASVIAAAGVDAVGGFSASSLDFTAFASEFLNSSLGARYFGDLSSSDPGLGVASYADFIALPAEEQDLAALDLFFLVLRDAGRDHNLATSPDYGLYTEGFAAITALFGSTAATTDGGSIDLSSREIKTENGGDITLLAPSGSVTVGINIPGSQPVDQGLLTDEGGNIDIYTGGNVNVGTSRIFTLRGGNEIIWSTQGSIDAGASSKTVQSAPPTQVIVDPQSANVETDLAGLATGGGIGVLAAVAGVPPGSVDLIAPNGTINAGDAGIRSTGNLNLAALQVLNASNIQAAGASTGVPTVTVAAPNLGAISAASATTGAGAAAATQQANNQNTSPSDESGTPSIYNVEVLGYGGGDDDSGSQGG